MSKRYLKFWFFIKMFTSVLLLVTLFLTVVVAAYSGNLITYIHGSMIVGCIIVSAYIGNEIGKYKRIISIK